MPGSQDMASEHKFGTNCKHQVAVHGYMIPKLAWRRRRCCPNQQCKVTRLLLKTFLSTTGPGPTQIPKHSKEYKLTRVSAFIIWLSCFDLRVLFLPRLEKMSPFSSRLDVKVHQGFQTNAPKCCHLNERLDQDWSVGELNSFFNTVFRKSGEKIGKERPLLT